MGQTLVTTAFTDNKYDHILSDVGGGYNTMRITLH
jgi:hypothetical protein